MSRVDDLRAQREAQYEANRKRAKATKAVAPKPKPDLPMTDTEVRKLGELEVVITRGAQAFIEVGVALATIREARWYRETHATFEAYCQEKWGMGAGRARQVIGASVVAGELTAKRLAVPSEGAVRQLIGVPPKKRAHVMRAAIKAAKDPERPTVLEVAAAAAPYKAAGAGREGSERPEAAGLAAQRTSAANTPDAPAVSVPIPDDEEMLYLGQTAGVAAAYAIRAQDQGFSGEPCMAAPPAQCFRWTHEFWDPKPTPRENLLAARWLIDAELKRLQEEAE